MDRAYTPEGLLVPRTEPDAMLSDPQAAARAVAMVTQGRSPPSTEAGFPSKPEITAMDGSRVPVQAEALLVHCDTVGSVDIAP